MELNDLTQMFEGGLKNDSVPETFELKHDTCWNAGSSAQFIAQFIKIVPLLSYGPSFNFSIWYIELLGIDEELIVNENLQKYNDQKEITTIKYILKHLRNRGHLETFKALTRESKIQLEDEEITELYNCLLDRGDFEQVETIMEKLIEEDKTYDEYALRQRYRAKFEEISTSEPRPCNRSHAAYCFDNTNRILYMFGGFKDLTTELNDFWIYDLNANKWIQSENSNPSPRGGSKMVFDAVGNQIFLLGRKPMTKSEDFKSDFHLFDVSKKSWLLIMPDTEAYGGPKCIYDHQVVLSQELRTIFVFGGRLANKSEENNDCYSDFYTYYINSNTWTRILVDCGHMMASNPDVLSIKSRAKHSMLFDKEKMSIYIFGGYRGKEKFTDVLKMNAKSKSITSIPTSAFDPDFSAAIMSSHGNSTSSIDEEKREIFFFSEESIWVYSLVTNEWTMICKNPMKTFPSIDYAVFDIHSRNHLIVKQGQLLSLELKKPSKETVILTCKYLIRKQKYEEMVANDPITALHFLQNNLFETVSQTDIEQVKDFHKLASLVFSRGRNVICSGDSEKTSEDPSLHLRRSLFNKLIDVLPENRCQPRKNLSNFIS